MSMIAIRPDHPQIAIDCPVLGRIVRVPVVPSFYLDTGDPDTSFTIWGPFMQCHDSYNMDPRCAYCLEHVNRVLHQKDVPPVITIPHSL